jgi:hypothetical protein
MFKKIVLFTGLIIIMQIAGKQDTTAKTWPPGSKIPVDSIIAAIVRGDSIILDRCKISGRLEEVLDWETPDGIITIGVWASKKTRETLDGP